MYLMKNDTILTTFVLDILKREKLISDKSTVILTGSASIECAKLEPNYDKYFNGESDIDVLIVVDHNIAFMKDIFSKYLLDLFSNNIINVLNFNFQYGTKRNEINIKYLKRETLMEWSSLNEVHFKSYRKHSISIKKQFMKCYGLQDYVIIPYKEEKLCDHYILHYDIELKRDYYLIDIHSMILFGTIIHGNNLVDLIDHFNFYFYSLLNLTDKKLFNLFGYYLYEKKSIGYSELRDLIKKFTELKIENIIDILKEKGAIYEIKGNVKKNDQVATICWARSNPKLVFEFMNRLSTYISEKKFILLVDDMCPKVLYARSDDEQKKINQKYLDTFPECNIYFSSDIFKKVFSENFMNVFIDMMKKISLNYYIDFLPEKKRNNISNINLGEFIHTFCELFLLVYGEKYLGINTMIFGRFSQNVIFMAKKQVKKESKLNYIIISRLNEEEMKNLI